MKILDIVRRAPVPEPWAEGDNIPWDDPGFSSRMLHEHLSQSHDSASRRSDTIDAQVDWIHRVVLNGKPSRILDLGCGPGLYTSRFADLGHQPRGIDFGPASIDYANRNGTVDHVLEDVRSADFGSDNDLVMMIFGELNVFRPSDATAILERAYRSLAPGGRVLLEVHTPEAVEAMGAGAKSWSSRERGLFSDSPHLLLEESFWDPEQRAATMRYIVIDAESGSATQYAQSMQQYDFDGYGSLLREAGLALDLTVPSLDGSDDAGDFVVLVASPIPR